MRPQDSIDDEVKEKTWFHRETAREEGVGSPRITHERIYTRENSIDVGYAITP